MRLTAGLLLGVIVVSLVYLFQFKMTGSDEYLLDGRPLSEMLGWLRLLALYDVVFVTLCTMAFASVVDE